MRFFKYILALSLFAATSFADTNVNTKTLQETLDNIDNWLGALSVVQGNSNAVVTLDNYLSALSNDFRVLESYLLSGTVSNQYTNVTWSGDGSATNSALIPALQYSIAALQNSIGEVQTNLNSTLKAFIATSGYETSAVKYAVGNTWFEAGDSTLAATNQLLYNQVIDNTSGFSTSTGRFTPPVPGYWAFSAFIRADKGATDTRDHKARIFKNWGGPSTGVNDVHNRYVQVNNPDSGNIDYLLLTTLNLTTSDYVSVLYFMESSLVSGDIMEGVSFSGYFVGD